MLISSLLRNILKILNNFYDLRDIQKTMSVKITLSTKKKKKTVKNVMLNICMGGKYLFY